MSTHDRAPKRLWFRWSLRTLFVLVTVIGVWLGWNLHEVRQRQALWQQYLLEHQARSRVFDQRLPLWGGTLSWNAEAVQVGPANVARIPLVRRLFGDEAHTAILRNREQDARAMMPYFPEATIRYYTGPVCVPESVQAIINEAFGQNPSRSNSIR